MATHSSVLAWRIPGMVEPGGLPTMGSHRVGHDWSNLAAAAAMTYNIEHIFICVFSIYISFKISYQFRFFHHFLIGLFFPYCWVLVVIHIFWMGLFSRCVWKYFLPVYILSLFFNTVFAENRFLIYFNKILLFKFFPQGPSF